MYVLGVEKINKTKLLLTFMGWGLLFKGVVKIVVFRKKNFVKECFFSAKWCKV